MTDSQLDIARLGGTTMGTTWSVSLVAPRQRDLHPLHAASVRGWMRWWRR